MSVDHAPRGPAAALALAALVVAAVLPTGALATGTDPALTLRECFAEAAGDSCQEAPHASLEIAADVAVSPDGSSAYVAATEEEPAGLGSDAITEFARGADGTLRPTGCLTFAGSRGCRAARIPLEGVRRLVITADGRDLYALADDGIAEFARGADGTLRPIGCLAFDTEGVGTSRCRHPEPGVETYMTGLAVSPDSRDLYLAAGIYPDAGRSEEFVSRLLEFSRRPDGTLAKLGCFGPGRGGRCAKVGGGEVGEPVVTGDGKALYAVDEDSLLRFPRTRKGLLGRPECVLGRSRRCGPPGAHPAGRYTTVALSPDGSRLYLGTTRATVAYSVSPAGTFTRLASQRVPSGRLALSPDGSRLYATAALGVTAFLTGDGGLSWSGETFPLQGVEGIAVTPDGSALLAVSWSASALFVLVPGAEGPLS